MKTSLPIFLAVFVALGASFGGFVAGSISQLGTAKQATVLNSTDTYPVQRTGDATLGLQVYRASGCAACHTEQVRQDGVTCDVVLTGIGKNASALEKALAEISASGSNADTNDFPKTILHGVTKETADAASDKITGAGGKVETHIVAIGADISRGWGIRRSVAADYLWDYPVQLGSLRAGPDLANVGVRLGNAGWQLQHLYAPQSVVEKSAMPPFRYLFEVRKAEGKPSPDALSLSGKFAPPEGYEVVPTDDAKNLAAYLLSLRADVPLYEAPFTAAVSATASATNAPVENK
jgi:cbb3-type cytochrome oxidase cytochrome c subunit